MDKNPSKPIHLHKPGRKTIITVVVLLVLLDLILYITMPSGNKKATSNQTASASLAGPDTRTDVLPPRSTQSINKDFDFQITDDLGRGLGKITYTLDSAEIRNEIVIKGEKATAVKGRTFLIINLKLKNDQDHSITVNSRNFIRLSVNGNDKEWLAPDIHNDPVEVQAISTKLTRVGFPINDTDRILKLQVGQVDGEKTAIDLKLNP